MKISYMELIFLMECGLHPTEVFSSDLRSSSYDLHNGSIGDKGIYGYYSIGQMGAFSLHADILSAGFMKEDSEQLFKYILSATLSEEAEKRINILRKISNQQYADYINLALDIYNARLEQDIEKTKDNINNQMRKILYDIKK